MKKLKRSVLVIENRHSGLFWRCFFASVCRRRIKLIVFAFIAVACFCPSTGFSDASKSATQEKQGNTNYSINRALNELFSDVVVTTNGIKIIFDSNVRPFQIYINDHVYAGFSTNIIDYSFMHATGETVKLRRRNFAIKFIPMGNSAEGVTYLISWGISSPKGSLNQFATLLPLENGKYEIIDEVGMSVAYDKDGCHTNLICEGVSIPLVEDNGLRLAPLIQDLNEKFKRSYNIKNVNVISEFVVAKQDLSQSTKTGRAKFWILSVIFAAAIGGVLFFKRKRSLPISR